MKTALIIGFGGCIGSMLRYGASVYVTRLLPSPFPYGTFIVNITGCLAIGILYGITLKYPEFSPEWRMFLAAGICGGYTTFSSFALENVRMLQTGNYTSFLLYSVLSFSGGLLAALLGVMMTRILPGT